MNKKIIILCCITLLSVTLLSQTPISTGAKTVHKSTASVHSQDKHKISRKQAINIALNEHKKAKVLSVTLNKDIYTIRLKTAMGKRTMKLGAKTGRILYDKLDWVKKITN